MMDDLISKKSLLSDYDKKHKGPAGRARKLIEDAPSIPAVPLEPLCEWLAKNACYDQLEDNGMRSRFSLLAEQWKFALTNWMEGLDADD